MDARAFRFANALVANASGAAGLEFAVVGDLPLCCCPGLLPRPAARFRA